MFECEIVADGRTNGKIGKRKCLQICGNRYDMEFNWWNQKY